MFAEVAVNTGAPLRQTFTYRVPEGLSLQAGSAVYVPWGTRTVQGIVCEITDTPSYEDARDIEGAIEDRPFVTAAQVAVARWMSDYYLAPLFDCIALFLPAGFSRRPLTFLRPAFWDDGGGDLSPAEAEVLRVVRDAGEYELGALKRALPGAANAKAIASLIRRGHFARAYRLPRPTVTRRLVKTVRLTTAPEAALEAAQKLEVDRPRLAPKAISFVEALERDGPMPLADARRAGFTAAVQSALAEVIEVAEEPLIRDPLAGRHYSQRDAPALTADQEAAARAICDALTSPVTNHQSPITFLLHGVTGSGKTEVYLAALDQAVATGRRAIVLVPEIALTPQTVRRFAERFPDRVAVLHSGLSPGEQFDVWHEVRAGHHDVVIGPRGALFAPVPDLGLVVIDEEHEWTYKQQDASPRYHARRTAEELCKRSGAVLVLGSATPDVESYFRAAEGKVQLLNLPERLVREGDEITPGPLPEIRVADLREELKSGNRGIFSRQLVTDMKAALDAKEQVILFLNRRGTASFLQCRDCGHTPECRSCAVALTLHEPGPALVCHYCDRRYPVPVACADCGNARLRPLGLGTERVEEAVHEHFPGARTIRWDRDVTRGKNAHEEILARFLAHEADVLVGTQMVAKGLDIPRVTVVGVISADIGLHVPDIRAGERTFQLLTQVAGRAGRGDRPGRVVIQTYTPEHHAIQAAARHDYAAMYEAEIAYRRKLSYPPFGRLVRLTLAQTGRDQALAEAARLANQLRSEIDRQGVPNLDVLGPAPALVPRIRGRWRWNIVLRGSDPAALVAGIDLPRGWTVDVDPVSIA